MTRLLLSLIAATTLLAGAPASRAFTLYGEIPDWFTDQTGAAPGDIYGPMNLGEEYRWVVPEIVYGFDESFLNYFGLRGVEEVEKAIQIFNELPPVSELNVDDYPTFSLRVNYRARDLELLDLKSFAMQAITEQLGLGTPHRFVFTLRGRDTPNQATNYLVIMRSFDPVSWEPTAYINGQLWTYLSIFENQEAIIKASTIPEPVDPLLLAEPVAAGTSSFNPTLVGYGSYFTGLTRDDVGGLRYIYRPENENVENLPADATGAAGVAGGGGGTGAWTPIPAPTTNAPTDGGGTTTAAFFPQGVRRGSDSIRFIRAGPGVVILPNGYAVTNRFTEQVRVVITNGVERSISQRVVRVLAAPDLIFSAEDLVQPNLAVFIYARGEVATSNDGINGAATLDGPGQFDGPSNITFEKVGPTFFNSQPSFLGQGNAITDFVWGSFDGSTNDPIVYPTGTTIRAIEERIFGGR